MWTGQLRGHKAWVEHCSFSSNLARLASCSGDGTVRVWDVEQQNCLATLSGHTAEVWSCHWHPKQVNLLCSSSSDHSVIVWDVQREQALFVLEKHEETVWCCRFSPDGSLMVSTSSDKTVNLWCCDQLPVRQPELVVTLERRDDALEFAEFSPDCRLLCTVCRDGNVRLWNISRNQKDMNKSISKQSVGDAPQSPCHSVDKKHLRELSPVCESPETSEDVLCETSESMLHIALYCQLRRRRAWVRACAFSPSDSHLLATCSSDGRICVWDTDQRQLIHELCGHKNIVWSCVFLEHKRLGLMLVSCSSDQTIRLAWDQQIVCHI